MNDVAKGTEATLAARLDAIEARLSYLVERQKKTEELFAEMTPILREVMGTATAKLGELDEKGYFAFGKELATVGERIVREFGPDDVRQLGDAVAGILRTVRAMTQPRVLQIASEASAVLENADRAEPIGLFGAARATRDDDVQKGMAVMMEVMRHVGRAARAINGERPSSADDKKAKLAAALGPRRKATSDRAPSRKDLGPPPACAVPVKGPRETAAVIDGVAFGADGHLADPKAWTPELAEKLAAAQGVALDDARWAVVKFARGDFETTSASPNIRRITQGTGLSTKDLYALFPKAPARTVAKVAGIPKPAGCI